MIWEVQIWTEKNLVEELGLDDNYKTDGLEQKVQITAMNDGTWCVDVAEMYGVFRGTYEECKKCVEEIIRGKF